MRKASKNCVLTLIVTLSCFVFDVHSTNCTYGDYDLSPLNRTWLSKSDGSALNITFEINLCEPLPSSGGHTSCHADTLVCMKFSNGSSYSTGNYSLTAKTRTSVENKETGEVWVLMNGDTCLEAPHTNLTVSINLKCGPTMGSPKFLDHDFCVSYFEWESHVFCKGDKPEEEVPCFLYDEQGIRYDLSPLANTTAGYLVPSDTNTDLYINVCRDVPSGTVDKGCPTGYGAYRKIGSECIGLGKPRDGLQLSARGLTLKYVSDSDYKPSGCTSTPSTTITFICPTRGLSKDPLLIQDFDCQYVVEWQTEYACPEAKLSSKTCLLTKEDADIDIDLRPLRNPPGADNPYKVRFVSHTDNTTYEAYLNVCDKLNIPCPTLGKIPACQTKPDDADFTRKMGSLDHMTLRYADNDLLLIYKHGAVCHHNNFQRQTIIKFTCDPNAENNGRGKPQYEHDSDCTYRFTWATKYACLDHPLNEECRVNNDGNRYDLSALVRTQGSNWLALGDSSSVSRRGEYYINVCHNILQTSQATGCAAGAAVCLRDTSGSTNLGRYEQAPTYNSQTKTVQIQYTNGDPCPGGTRSSTITFMCKPGETDSAPTLTYVSLDECIYEFEWHTSSACVLGHYTGTDCKVYDAKAGFNFDLAPLRKSGPPYYSVDPGASESVEYQLNVCGPVTGTSCNSLTEPLFDVANTGICQQPKAGNTGSSYVAGQYSTSLRYFDGMINLTYTDGTRYHDDAKTPRKSEIAFLCDPDAGLGKPIFLTEVASEHYYGFEWRTAYACPTQPIECTAVDLKTNDEYDLSRLSMDAGHGNWEVVGSNRAYKYYINVCRALNKVAVGDGCDALASACRTKLSTGQPETIEVENFGKIKSGLTVVEKGRLRLTYEGAKTCNNGSATVPWRTTLEFSCAEAAVVSRPNPPVMEDQCTYSFVWVTAYACPLKSAAKPAEKPDNVTEPCTVKDPTSDYVFNLQPLTKTGDHPYIVTVGSTDYKLNICGNLSTAVCDNINGVPAAVCSVGMGGTKTGLAEGRNYKLEVSEAGLLGLTYHGLRKANGERYCYVPAVMLAGRQPTQVQINFECDRTVDRGEPAFVSEDDGTYIFSFKTSLACLPQATDCFVQDRAGNQYDLGFLTRTDGWSVLDTRDSSTKYYINVCRPVNNIDQSNCPDGPIGGCQVASNGKSYNIGYIQSQPVANNGTLSVRYRNGDVCHKGTALESHRSTRINFFCSKVEDGPVYESETATCEYVFNWRTPAACPLMSATGDNCKVNEPQFGYEFDLSLLMRNRTNYVVSSGGYNYILNLCQPLQGNTECNTTGEGVGVCQTKPHSTFTPVNAGKASSKLQYSSGQLTLTYNEGKDSCHGKFTRKTIITFLCDQLKNGQEGPVFIKETENCQYLFEWTTHYACTPHTSTVCSYSGGGNSYDLTGLTLYNDNYDYTDTRAKKRYIINVCGSLIHKSNAKCPYNAAACMVDLNKTDSDTTKYQSLGTPTGSPSLENGKLVLYYTRGGACGDGKDFTTKIVFICDPSAKDTSPTGHFMNGECEHHFLWATAAACPINQPPPDTGTPTSNITCKVMEPVTGTQLDLSTLKAIGKPWSVPDNSGHLYEFNICAPLKSSKCTNATANIGVCQSETGDGKRTYNAGNVVSDLWYDDGVVVYNLTGGDRCHGGQYQRSTIINFVCNGHRGIGRPVYLDETDDCTYYIAWHTNLVCASEVKCSVDTDDFHTLDLSPLARNPDNIVQSSFGDALYYLSVCQPMQPVAGTLCPSGAAACEVKPGPNNPPVSLGKPKASPTFDKATGDVIISYLNGSTCDVDKTKNFTSKITFTCQPGPVRSNPVLLDKVGCEYIFQWPTYAVCYEKTPAPPTDVCGYTDPWSKQFFNFTSLSKSTPFEVQYMTTKYLINMCGTVKSPDSCGQAMVCRDSDGRNFGEASNFWAERDSGMIKLTYKHGEKCPDGTTASSQILFKCDRNVDVGQPEYLTGSGCKVEFFWRTSVVCPPIETQCSYADGAKLYDMSLLSRDKSAWELKDKEGNMYWINVCGALDRSVGHGHCGQNAGACRLSSAGHYDNLGEVTQQHLYKDDKKNAIVLEYDQGGAVCSNGRTRSDNDAAKTRINFICGDTYGGPVYKSTEECVFEFDWKTKLACQVQRDAVPFNKGKIIDPRSGGTINLNPILTTSYDVQAEDGSGTAYKVTLDGNSTYCLAATVCEVKDLKHPRLLGTFSSVKYYMDDDMLEAVYTSTEHCSGDLSGKNVTSVIHFHCSHAGKESLSLLYESKDCIYVFDWETKTACFEAQVIMSTAGPSGTGSGPGSSSQGGGKGGVSAKTVGAIVGVFTTAIILCILLVVFHKQERRAACLGGVRKILRHKSSEYTQLPTDAADDLQGEDDILTFSDPTDSESNRDEDPLVTVTTTPASYHDDSDEDLLA